MTITHPSTSAKSSDQSGFLAHVNQLHKLIGEVVVTTARGEILSPEEGMSEALKLIRSAQDASAKIMMVGNGGSAAIASHQAIDFWKAAGVPAVAFNDPAQLTCLSNDFGYEHVFSKAIEMFAQTGDVLIAISSSGRSKNILNAVSAARSKGCSVITYAGFNADAPLLSMGDLNFYIDSDHYGLVEVAHLALIHYLTDRLYAYRQEVAV